MHDLRLHLPNNARQLPGGGQIDLICGSKRNEIGSLGGATTQFAVRVRHEHRAVAQRPTAENGQEDLVLSAAPGARGVDVEGEHSSHSFENFRPT